MERVAKSTRWSLEEWAVIERAAGSMAPTTWVREAALGVARRAFESGGPAAPEERESSRAAAREPGGVVGVGPGGDPGTDLVAASSRSAEGRGSSGVAGPAVAAPSRAPEFARARVRDVDGSSISEAELTRPVGSAGSVGPVPPAGGGAASVVDPPPAADAPADGGVSLLEAATRSIVARGLAATPAAAQVMALRAIRSGQVEVFGEPCRDPERLVDPGDLA